MLWSNDDTAALTAELASLTTTSRRLADAVAQAAGRLNGDGLLPPDDLKRDLAAYRTAMAALFERTSAGAALPGSLDLPNIERSLEQRQATSQVAELVADIQRLVHPDDPAFGGLTAARQDAEALQHALRQNLAGHESLLAELREGRHALQAVLRLVREADLLSDDAWVGLNDSVVAAYGRALATAIARRKIVLEETASPVDITPRIAGSSKLTSSMASETGRYGRDSFATPADPGLATASQLAPVFEPIAEDAAMPVWETDSPVQSAARVERAPGVPLFSRSESGATPATVCTSRLPACDVQISGLVASLTAADKLAAAVQLAQVVEEGGAACPLPAWLLRALILGRHVTASGSELADRIEVELQNYGPDKLPAVPSERLGFELLLRAAVLPLTLLGPSPIVAGVLRSLPISPSLAQLYNYCARLSALGDRLQGLTSLFGSPLAAADLDRERGSLEQEMQLWCDEARAAIGYTKTAPLFSRAHWSLTAAAEQRSPGLVEHWRRNQEALSRAWKLLAPVREHRLQSRVMVRHDLARLVQEVREARRDHPEDLLRTIHSAIDLAQRWLQFDERSPNETSHFVPTDVEQLRAATLAQTDAVLVELNALMLVPHAGRKGGGSGMVAAGVKQCSRVVQHVHAVLAGKQQQPAHEPPPQQVLLADDAQSAAEPASPAESEQVLQPEESSWILDMFAERTR